MRRSGLALWILAVAVAATAGCGKPVLREADPSLGDYYTKAEYKKLSDEQRQQYCQDLADQLETYQDQVAQGEEALASLSKGTPRLTAEVDSLRVVQSRLTAELAAEESLAVSRYSTLRPIDTVSSTLIYSVKPGDSLWKISREFYGRGDDWERLYRLIKDKVPDPNVIRPGQEISIPR